jgi:hypothetical protein
MRRRRPRVAGPLAVGSLVVALVLGGCGLAAPQTSPRPTPASAVARAQATREYPSPPAPRQAAGVGWASGGPAVVAFARAYINWNADTVSGDMRALATHSVGQARAAMQLAAAQTAGDYELQRGGIANQGVVEAVAPLRDQRDQYVVVTRELTTATATTAYEGLAPAWHVAVATVTQISDGRWVVSAWQPQS